MVGKASGRRAAAPEEALEGKASAHQGQSVWPVDPAITIELNSNFKAMFCQCAGYSQSFKRWLSVGRFKAQSWCGTHSSCCKARVPNEPSLCASIPLDADEPYLKVREAKWNNLKSFYTPLVIQWRLWLVSANFELLVSKDS